MGKQFVGVFPVLLFGGLGWATYQLYLDNDAFDLRFLNEHEAGEEMPGKMNN